MESKDACTQTDRSDYMMIKNRQRTKEIMMMAKQGLLPKGVTAQQMIQNINASHLNNDSYITDHALHLRKPTMHDLTALNAVSISDFKNFRGKRSEVSGRGP